MRKRILIPFACVALLVGLVSLATRSTREKTTRADPTHSEAAVQASARTTVPTPHRLSRVGEAPARPAEASSPELSRSSSAPAPERDPLDSVAPEKRPLILAIRDRGTSPAEKRRAMLLALEASGKSDASWTAGARKVFESWHAQLPEEFRDKLALREVRCFRAGCAVDVIFESEAEYVRAARLFPRLKESGMQHGGRVQTPLEPHSGTYGTASWIMLSPTEEQLEAAKGV